MSNSDLIKQALDQKQSLAAASLNNISATLTGNLISWLTNNSALSQEEASRCDNVAKITSSFLNGKSVSLHEMIMPEVKLPINKGMINHLFEGISSKCQEVPMATLDEIRRVISSSQEMKLFKEIAHRAPHNLFVAEVALRIDSGEKLGDIFGSKSNFSINGIVEQNTIAVIKEIASEMGLELAHKIAQRNDLLGELNDRADARSRIDTFLTLRGARRGPPETNTNKPKI